MISLIHAFISYSDLRTRRKADHGADHSNDQQSSSQKHSKSIRGRRARKGRKRTSSSSTKSNNNAQSFKPTFHQRTSSNKFKPLNRNPRQHSSSSSSTEPLKVVTSNQIVQVSQEKDRKYHFE